MEKPSRSERKKQKQIELQRKIQQQHKEIKRLQTQREPEELKCKDHGLERQDKEHEEEENTRKIIADLIEQQNNKEKKTLIIAGISLGLSVVFPIFSLVISLQANRHAQTANEYASTANEYAQQAIMPLRIPVLSLRL